MELIDFGIVLFLAGLCLAFVQMFKEAGLPSRYAGFVSLAVGITLALIGGAADRIVGSYWELVLIGIMAGLVAAGTWSAPKAVIESQRQKA